MTRVTTDAVLGLHEIDRSYEQVVGGKGAHLGELSRIDGLRVPAGYCVTTGAYRRVMAQAPSIEHLLERLSRLRPDDRDTIIALSLDVRRSIEAIAIPDDLQTAITRSLDALGRRAAYAVRSSATAEDLPSASFAGQQETYLNVVGAAAILDHVRRCWASLFTERAVTYRLLKGVDHQKVEMAVVVQRMVFPHSSGVLFTADPVTGHRKVASVEATFGLGEALVSGAASGDIFSVRGGTVSEKRIATKPLAIVASPDGGTRREPIEPEQQARPALTDAQVLQLVELGRRIESHFGRPQDIEWCMADAEFQIVQSRPITTLFPVPEADDRENHVYVSVGHQQMMTDPMTPLGLSVWQLTTPRPMAEAGGRLFVDVTQILASPTSRAGLLTMLGKSDPLIGDALQTLLDRGDFIPSRPDGGPAWTSPGAGAASLETDPAIVADLMARSEAAIAALKRAIQGRSGAELLDFIREDIRERRRVESDPRSLQVIMAGMEAAWWLNDHLGSWLGEKNVADILTQAVPHNVTSEMGLALLDVADVIRPHDAVVDLLRHVEDDAFLESLPDLPGGRDALDAIQGWLAAYGMRGVGEIDITRPRWSERPSMLVPMLLGHIDNCQPGAAARQREEGRRRALEKEAEILTRLRVLPDGDAKAEHTKRMIDRVRTFAGYREYPKYALVSRYLVYKQALIEEADRLVRAGIVREREDVFFLRFHELQDVVRTRRVDEQLIADRKEAFSSYWALTPPRVVTSDGEIIAGSYRRADLPTGALVGLPVSAGIVEGRARVVLDIRQAVLETGDILVTAYTDPSWTPLFVAIKGVVTEVGGLMTHGAVVAREYGLPAVVGIERATSLIRDGQRIRVNGTEGYVELL